MKQETQNKPWPLAHWFRSLGKHVSTIWCSYDTSFQRSTVNAGIETNTACSDSIEKTPGATLPGLKSVCELSSVLRLIRAISWAPFHIFEKIVYRKSTNSSGAEHTTWAGAITAHWPSDQYACFFFPLMTAKRRNEQIMLIISWRFFAIKGIIDFTTFYLRG